MKIAFKESTDYQLLHPVTDEPLVDAKGEPMLVEIFGKHTSVYKNALNKLLKSSQSSKKTISIEDSQSRGLDLLCECIGGFKNLDIETETGKLDPKNVRSVLEDAFWIREQVDAQIVNLENFTMASKKA